MSDGEESQGATDETDITRISKVRYYDKTVTVERTRPNMKSDEQVISGPWRDTPRPQFRNAFAALIPIALKLAEIDAKAWVGTTVVSQVSISKDKRGRRQISLVVIRPLEHGAITFNTPIRTERSDESEVGAQYAGADLVKAVDRVCREALIYVNGERVQLVLDLADGKAKDGEGEGEGESQIETGAAAAPSTNGKHGAGKGGVKGASRSRSRVRVER